MTRKRWAERLPQYPWLVAMVAAVLLLGAVGWADAPRTGPLYDGLGFPDEPYRYVAPPPAAAKTKPPTSARGELQVYEGDVDPGEVTSAEDGPQVSLYVSHGTVSAPSSATRIRLGAVPRAPGGGPDAAGIEGNVYVVTVSSDAGAATFSGRSAGDITLRVPVLTGVLPAVVYRAGPHDSWHSLPTQRIGRDNFQAPLRRIGEYALAKPGRTAAHGTRVGRPAESGSGGVALLLLGGTVIVMALILVGLRVRAARTRGTTL